MDVKIIWSPEAVADLTEIREHIARDSEVYAVALIERILASVDYLQQFPNLGRRVPEMDDDSIRQVIEYPYRIIYRVKGYSVDLAAVVHCSRELERALGNRQV